MIEVSFEVKMYVVLKIFPLILGDGVDEPQSETYLIWFLKPFHLTSSVSMTELVGFEVNIYAVSKLQSIILGDGVGKPQSETHVMWFSKHFHLISSSAMVEFLNFEVNIYIYICGFETFPACAQRQS